mmetsp:Transcript_24459/g.35959  ORF Transcript_24459/g.35959 Transcript_24459/m.35959 type:complete len:256 (-) Transcript_24459:203-970(-)
MQSPSRRVRGQRVVPTEGGFSPDNENSKRMASKGITDCEYRLFCYFLRPHYDYDGNGVPVTLFSQKLMDHKIFQTREEAQRCCQRLDRYHSGYIKLATIFNHANEDGQPFRNEIYKFIKTVSTGEANRILTLSDSDEWSTLDECAYETSSENSDHVFRELSLNSITRDPRSKYSTSTRMGTTTHADCSKRKTGRPRSARDRIIGRMITRIKDNAHKRCQMASEDQQAKHLCFDELSDVQKRKVEAYINRNDILEV